MERSVTIGRLNAAIYRNMQMLLSSKFDDLDIKNGQYDFFLAISLCEGMSQKQLSQLLHISKSSVAKAVKQLVDAGYVKKEKDEADARMDRLFLTALGRSNAPKVENIFMDLQRTMGKGLSAEEIAQLLSLLQRVLHNLLSENANAKEAGGDA